MKTQTSDIDFFLGCSHADENQSLASSAAVYDVHNGDCRPAGLVRKVSAKSLDLCTKGAALIRIFFTTSCQNITLVNLFIP